MLLADGRVLVKGCASPCDSIVVGFFDPAAGTFTDAATQVAGGGPGVLLADGKVLIVGGCPPNYAGTKAQVFDPVSGPFSPCLLYTSRCV